MKYSKTPYILINNVMESINNKISDLVLVTKTKYSIYTTLITTIGLKENPNALNIQNIITLNDLFR